MNDTPNQATKLITKNWVEINDDTPKSYNTSSQNKFKFSMIKSNLYVYSEAYILLSGTITFTKVAAGGGNNNIQLVFTSVLHLLIA